MPLELTFYLKMFFFCKNISNFFNCAISVVVVSGGDCGGGKEEEDGERGKMLWMCLKIT